eukprot:SAG31_NODE_16167_length_720_cov_1.165862_1_plen_74_part_00
MQQDGVQVEIARLPLQEYCPMHNPALNVDTVVRILLCVGPCSVIVYAPQKHAATLRICLESSIISYFDRVIVR